MLLEHIKFYEFIFIRKVQPYILGMSYRLLSDHPTPVTVLGQSGTIITDDTSKL